MTIPRRPRRRTAFVDSSAFYALSDRDDLNHHLAQAIAHALEHERWTLYTSNYVVAEQHALHLNRLNRDLAFQALTDIYTSGIRIERVTPRDDERAFAIISQYSDKEFSFTDATSFAIMERLGIPYAFAFDRNFIQYRLTVLTAQLPQF